MRVGVSVMGGGRSGALGMLTYLRPSPSVCSLFNPPVACNAAPLACEMSGSPKSLQQVAPLHHIALRSVRGSGSSRHSQEH